MKYEAVNYQWHKPYKCKQWITNNLNKKMQADEFARLTKTYEYNDIVVSKQQIQFVLLENNHWKINVIHVLTQV